MKKAYLFLTFSIFMSVAVQAQSPNYTLPQNWMCHPVLKPTDIARQQSLTVTVMSPDMTADSVLQYVHPGSDTGVDLFYVYPTISMDTAQRNIEIAQIDTITAKFVYAEQVGIYAKFGRVFAPYYRQASVGVFVKPAKTEAEKLRQANFLETAYLDVEAAFDNYLENYNKGNKIILMGHSQGADHMRFLLRRRFDNNPVLASRLVVAISGGEPNYSARGSRTGGSLENIKTLGAELESGCMISWRTWRDGTLGAGIDSSSFFYNHYFVDKGFLYQTCDPRKPGRHQESNYEFGYSTEQPVTRYITLSPDSTSYWAFDDMFRARYYSDSTKDGCSYLMIKTNSILNDLRKIPNPTKSALLPEIPIPDSSNFSPTPNNNYHCWDMQFVQGDLLNLLPELIKITTPLSSVNNEPYFENAIQVYPNPASDRVHVNIDNSIIKSITLYNAQGKLTASHFTNDFSVGNLDAGLYYIQIRTEKSSYFNKLVKQ